MSKNRHLVMFMFRSELILSGRLSQGPLQRCPLEQKSLRTPHTSHGSHLIQDGEGPEAGNLGLHHCGLLLCPGQGVFSVGFSGPPRSAGTGGLAGPQQVQLEPTEGSQQEGGRFQSQLFNRLRPWAPPPTDFGLLKCQLPPSLGSPEGSVSSQSIGVPPVPLFPVTLLLSPCPPSSISFTLLLPPPLFQPSGSLLTPSLPTPEHPRRGCALNPSLQLHPRELQAAWVPAEEVVSGAFLTGGHQ